VNVTHVETNCVETIDLQYVAIIVVNWSQNSKQNCINCTAKILPQLTVCFGSYFLPVKYLILLKI